NEKNESQIFESQLKIFVKGKTYNKQIYLKKGNVINQLSYFAPWENINRLAFSLGDERLVVYHRSNHEKSYRLSVFDLKQKNQTFIRSFHPGMACGRIFFQTETTDLSSNLR
ncbi:hypothetical protein, partial [Leptospira interrogans]|uniref:hypothetical protein n=1 Tax=Leptospira interrogans TaxID=173 RepID=UPI0002BD8F61